MEKYTPRRRDVKLLEHCYMNMGIYSLDFGLILPKFGTSVGALGIPNLDGPAAPPPLAAAGFIGLMKSMSWDTISQKFHDCGRLTESEVLGSPMA